MKADLLIIDPQVDFCAPSGKLYVPGADEDCIRLQTMIKRVGKNLNDIHVTLDSHHNYHIAHPIFWVNDSGKHPDPFTVITLTDIKNGVWRASNPVHQNAANFKKYTGQDHYGAEEYVASLEKNGRYPLMIWPPHCLIGSDGYKVQGHVFDALLGWEEDYIAQVDYVTKGSNFMTEHYSAVMADVPDSADPSTLLNMNLIETLKRVDIIGISGQALSHCVANTIRDIANNFGEENIKKFYLIEDTVSPVSGCEGLAKDFVNEMLSRGMNICKSTEFLN